MTFKEAIEKAECENENAERIAGQVLTILCENELNKRDALRILEIAGNELEARAGRITVSELMEQQ